MKPNYKELLRQKREKKFELLEEARINENECNHSEGDGCVACTHPNTCLFSKTRIEYDDKLTKLQLQKKDLEEYIKHGKDTVGYDKNRLRVELYKIKKELQELKRSNL